LTSTSAGEDSLLDSTEPQSRASRSSYRWTICALLFVATTINYVDRQVLGILAPTLQRELHWSEAAYGDVVRSLVADVTRDLRPTWVKQ